MKPRCNSGIHSSHGYITTERDGYNGSHSEPTSYYVMPHLFYFWQEQRETGLSPAAIQSRLDGGEDVEGLADLPIKEMIERLKSAFPGAKETAGQLAWPGAAEAKGDERFIATWSWQFLRLETHNLSDEHCDTLFEIAHSFSCPVYDPQLNLKME